MNLKFKPTPYLIQQKMLVIRYRESACFPRLTVPSCGRIGKSPEGGDAPLTSVPTTVWMVTVLR